MRHQSLLNCPLFDIFAEIGFVCNYVASMFLILKLCLTHADLAPQSDFEEFSFVPVFLPSLPT
jgi:hypothetical protein